jgi:[glutamine synthetase] adenylyltransferase / [glutamine synthetase]-adenylyl-L-tyrosine phosphorylase
MNNFETLIAPEQFHWGQLKPMLLDEHGSDLEFIESIKKLALGSNYATAQLIRYPQLLNTLKACQHFEINPEQLEHSLESLQDLDEIKKQLRLFRHQKMIEITYLDICHNESVQETLLHLTQLADLLITQTQHKAEQILSAKHGQPVDEDGEPMQLNIIGMGKLGGGELNFSSDIDLICSYSEDGQLKGFGQLSYNQFFTNTVKMIKQLLNDMTADGFVYRVDLRLRPWGDSGPIVLSHHSFEHYYQLHGREWEQYAMVKARVITGSDSDKKYLSSIIKPFVYRRYHDYRVFEGLAQMKHKIDQKARRSNQKHNVKTGHGGIREIEFFVQAFQILKGGRNHHLQTPSIYKVLNVLSDQEITDQPTINIMREAYDFLRLLENRIQMLNDQQTHDIPDKQNYLDRISLLTGFDNWEVLKSTLDTHQQAVSTIFSSLFIQDESRPPAYSAATHLDEMDRDEHIKVIAGLGFMQVQEIHDKLSAFYKSKALMYMSDKAKKRFRSFFPELLKQVAAHEPQSELLDKMLSLLSSIAGRSVYFELLYQNIPLLVKLVHLFDSSNWIASEVTRHPILLESLLYPEHLDNRFDEDMLSQALSVQLNNVSGDEEMELDVLRQFKREQTIIIATAEIAQQISTDEVSLHLSKLAEILLQAVYELSLGFLKKQYGLPQCLIDEQPFTPALGIIAYGKLGGFELHYQSDLDIIFLHNSSGQKQFTNGPREIDNATFFSRLAQKIISRITLLTAAGKLYEIDTRLRPDGASGMLVSSVAAYHQYQMEKAWTWEHQAIIRARLVAGDRGIIQNFSATRTAVLTQQQDSTELANAITDMRDKMYQAKNPPEGELINIKHSRGCMVDIEFMVQYQVLLHANKFASLCESTDNIGLINELHRLGLVDDDFLQLGQIYQTFHKWLHTRVLQNLSPEITSQEVKQEILQVKSCWKKYLPDNKI